MSLEQLELNLLALMMEKSLNLLVLQPSKLIFLGLSSWILLGTLILFGEIESFGSE